MARTSALLERASFWRIFALAFVLLVAVHAVSLQDPPYWDALMGAFAQGHWLATHSFSPLAVLRDARAFNDGGACVYPFSVYPWVAGALEASGAAPTTTYLVLHLLSFASAAAIVSVLFATLRGSIGPGLAALVAASLAVQPMFRALACQMNMDVPLAACTLLSIAAVSQRRFGASSAWAAAALVIKPTAIILVAGNLAALGLRVACPAWFGADRDAGESTRVRTALLVHAGLFALFVAELAVASRFGKSAPGVSLFGGTAPFLLRRLWTLPEFGLALALYLACVPWIVARVVRRVASALEIDLMLFLLAFTGFYCQYRNVLPRYFLQAWPVLLAALVIAVLHTRVLHVRALRRAVVVALAAFALFGIVNAHGRFHPTRYAGWSAPESEHGEERRLVSNDGWLLERSLEYRDDMALDQELAVRLQQRGVRVVAGWPLLQLLAIPALGYVIAPLPLAAAQTPIDFAAAPIGRVRDLAPDEPRVRVLSPNVYDDDAARILPGDEVLDTVRRGRLRAFVVSRPADSGARRR